MQLQPTGPNAPRYVVHMIGFLKKKGICVTQPVLNGELAMIRENQELTVRFFSGKNAYAFETVALKQTMSPYPMLHLAYPKTLKMHQVREKSRLQLELIAVALNSERGLQESLKISDLSTGGASLMTTSDLGSEGDELMLKFKITVEQIEMLLELNCQIRNVVQPTAESKGNYIYGVSFHDVPPNMLISLSAFSANTALDQM
ncbi:MAG: hypothetical protein RIR18_1943 [Pseudomonadota bacterium]